MMNNLPVKLTAGCNVSPIGLVLRDNLTLEAWDEIGATLAKINGALQWLIGDWIVFGEDHFTTDKIETAASLTGYTYHTLYNCNYVARNVPFSRRRESLSWSHHYEVASLDGDEQEKWLLAAETHGLSHKALRASIRIGEVVTDAQLSAGGLKVNAPVSLAGLGLKLRLLQSRTKVEEMDRGQLEEAEKNLRPFVDFHHRIQELLTTNGQPDAS